MSQREYIIPDEIIASNRQRFVNVVIDYVARIALTFLIGIVAGTIGVLTGMKKYSSFFKTSLSCKKSLLVY